MGKRGPKPKGKVKIEWSANFAYAIGLLVSDGNLSSDKRHIAFTSKDLELVKHFQKALGIGIHIGKKSSGSNKDKKYFTAQFSDVLFYQFLLQIGLMPNKSKVISAVKIPDYYFFDFLRGSFDGDGCTYSYFDPRWKSSFMFYTTFVSASQAHILWLQENIKDHLHIQGHITRNRTKVVYQPKYAKSDSLKLLWKMYSGKEILFLGRKRLKIEKMLRTIGRSLND